jgi:hypothetical protein
VGVGAVFDYELNLYGPSDGRNRVSAIVTISLNKEAYDLIYNYLYGK